MAVTVKEGGRPKDISNWIMGEVLRSLKDKAMEIEEVKFKPSDLVELIGLADKGTISGSIAKKVFKDMFESGMNSKKIIEEKGLTQVSDEGAIRDIISKVLDENPQSIIDFKNGKIKAVGYLVGQVMKASKGKANPQLINKLLLEKLNKR